MTTPKMVAVIDDDRRQADTVAELLVDAGLKPVIVPDPWCVIATVDELTAAVKARATAAICDHRLSPKGLATFDGAQAVAKLYDERIPALLMTQYAEMDNDVSIRRWRHKVPVVISRDDVDDPAAIRVSLDLCIRELEGERVPTRRAHRSIVRIAEWNQEDGVDVLDVFVMQWRPHTAVRLPLDCIPEEFRGALKDFPFLIAEVNIEARDSSELFFHNFEAAPQPPN